MSEGIWEKWRFTVGVRWLWTVKHGRELLSRPKLTRVCSTKTRRLLDHILNKRKYVALIVLVARVKLFRCEWRCDFDPFLILALDGGDWSDWSASRSWEKPRYSLKRRFDGPRSMDAVNQGKISLALRRIEQHSLTFRHRASSIQGQAFHCSPENVFYIFNQQIYFIIWYLLDRASLI